MSQALQDTLGMFAFLALELSVLFIGISLLVGALQRHIPPERVEALLSSGHSRSYFLAAGLGAVTPFCSCSTIPMLKGLIRARAGFGPMMVFLFSSPLLNPVIVVLLAVTFGVTLTAIYVSAALLVALAAGWLLQVSGFENTVRRDSGHTSGCSGGNTSCSGTPATSGCASSGCTGEQGASRGKYSGLWRETWGDFMNVLPYLMLGVAIGSVIYGFVPTGLLEKYAGADTPLAIPAAAVIGIPLYIRAEAVIPLAGALMAKGVGAGSLLALIIGSAGASLTELILLRALFTTRLLAAFVAVILIMAMAAGYVTFLFF